MKKETKRTTWQILLRILFLVYGAAMLWLLFGQRIENSVFNLRLEPHQGVEQIFVAPDWKMIMYQSRLEQNINLIPFSTVKLYWKLLHTSSNTELLQHAVINLVGNVVMFVPLGIFLPGIFFKKPNFFKLLLSVTIMIVLVEIIQLFTLLGSCDVDDLILNLVGASIGYLIWKLSTLRRKY